ncbi:MAG: KH domain-containing protein [Ignavibacteriaceae bacterium]|nr:KH domain-containing protein [Ignavibacteriaceae bacterium]
MKEFIEYIVKRLVDKPEKVRIEESNSDQKTIDIKIEVDKTDIGKIVGKQGKNVNALRTLLTAVAAKDRYRATLQVKE